PEYKPAPSTILNYQTPSTPDYKLVPSSISSQVGPQEIAFQKSATNFNNLLIPETSSGTMKLSTPSTTQNYKMRHQFQRISTTPSTTTTEKFTTPSTTTTTENRVRSHIEKYLKSTKIYSISTTPPLTHPIQTFTQVLGSIKDLF